MYNQRHINYNTSTYIIISGIFNLVIYLIELAIAFIIIQAA